jgi:hypothetical protein
MLGGSGKNCIYGTALPQLLHESVQIANGTITNSLIESPQLSTTDHPQTPRSLLQAPPPVPQGLITEHKKDAATLASAVADDLIPVRYHRRRQLPGRRTTTRPTVPRPNDAVRRRRQHHGHNRRERTAETEAAERGRAGWADAEDGGRQQRAPRRANHSVRTDSYGRGIERCRCGEE